MRRGAETIEGVAALYRALPDGARAVATSASRETALARFEAAGLPLPRVLVTADDVAAGKPAPDCYLLAARCSRCRRRTASSSRTRPRASTPPVAPACA